MQAWAKTSEPLTRERLSTPRCNNGGLALDLAPMLLHVMARHGTQRLFVLAHPMIRKRINAMLAEVGGHGGGGRGMELRDAGERASVWSGSALPIYIHRCHFPQNFELAIEGYSHTGKLPCPLVHQLRPAPPLPPLHSSGHPPRSQA